MKYTGEQHPKKLQIYFDCIVNMFYLRFIKHTKHTIMKSYIVITRSSWSFEIGAKNYREAISAGRKVCRDHSEKFVSVRAKK